MNGKRFLSALTAAAIALTSIFVPCAGAEIEEALKLIDLDFEDYSFDVESDAGFSSMTDGATVYPTKLDSDHGTSLATVFVGEALYSWQLGNAISEGMYHFGFEIQKPDFGAYTYIRLCNSVCKDGDDTANMSETFAMNKEGYIGATEASAGWNLISPGRKFVPGEWKKVDMWLDFDNRKITYYIDNEFFTVQPFKPAINDVKQIDFYLPRTVYLDNIVLEKVNYAMACRMAESGEEVPEALLAPIVSEFETGKAGNIFFDRNGVKIKHMLENVTDEKIEVDISYTIERYNGEIVARWTDKADIKAGEVWTSELAPENLIYDIYNLKVVCEDKKQNRKIDSVCEFSVANGVLDGTANKEFGVNTEIMLRKSDMVDYMDVLAATGLGFYRDGITWNRMETVKGVYGMAEIDDTRITRMSENGKEYNMECLMLVDGYATVYYEGKNVPKTQEGLDSLEEMAYQLAKTYPEVKYFEWTNEVDSGRQTRITYEEYETSLRRFYKGIKRGNPDAFVVGCCTGMQNWYFVEAVLKAGGGDYMDAISVHPYANILSPETCDYVSLCKSVRAVLDKYNYKGELWVSETGFSSTGFHSTEQEQATHTVRQYALNTAYDCADVMITYAFRVADGNPRDIESGYGIVNGPDGGHVPYSAKPAYLAICNYFNMVKNAEFKEVLTKGKASIYHYTRENGESTVMLSADMGNENIGLSLGTDSVIMYDLYGNETKLWGIDGKFSFVVGDQPVYIKGNFSKVELCEPLIYFDNTLLAAKPGEPYSIVINNNSNMKFSLATESKPNIEISGNISALNKKMSLTAMIKEDTGKYDYSYSLNDIGVLINRDNATVKVTKDGKTYGSFNIGFDIIPSLEWEFKSLPYDSGAEHWVGELTVKNPGTKTPVSGRIEFDTPVEMKSMAGELEFKNLGPEQTKTFKFNIPKKFTDTWTKYIATATLSTGEKVEISLGSLSDSRTDYSAPRSLETGVIRHVKKTPIIDGKIDKDEWSGGKQVDFDQSEVSYGSQGMIVAGMHEDSAVGGEAEKKEIKNDFSGTIYALWDEENLYYAAEVFDDIHYNIEPPGHWYMSDDFFIDVAPTMLQRHVSRFDVALSSFDNITDKKKQFVHALYRIVGRNMPWNGTIESSEVAVVREGYKTTYEVKIPWTEIISGDMGTGSNFNFSIGVRDHDETRDKTFTFSQWKCLVEAEK